MMTVHPTLTHTAADSWSMSHHTVTKSPLEYTHRPLAPWYMQVVNTWHLRKLSLRNCPGMTCKDISFSHVIYAHCGHHQLQLIVACSSLKLQLIGGPVQKTCCVVCNEWTCQMMSHEFSPCKNMLTYLSDCKHIGKHCSMWWQNDIDYTFSPREHLISMCSDKTVNWNAFCHDRNTHLSSNSAYQ